MTREEAKVLLPIIQAYAEGKTIQVIDTTDQCGKWEDVTDLKINTDFEEYRIKPEPKYRPFKDAKECWAEMQKHQPFGVVKNKYYVNYQTYRAFTCLTDEGCDFSNYEDETFESSFKNLLFADGLPFGVKIEEG